MAVIFIKKPMKAKYSGPYLIPAGGCILISSTAGLDTETWEVVSTANSKLIRIGTYGATGGTETHSHTFTALNGHPTHSHSLNGRSGDTSEGPGGSGDSGWGYDNTVAAGSHTHYYSCGSSSTSSGVAPAHGTGTTGSASNYPAYVGKYIIENKSSEAAPIPLGGIVMGFGTLSLSGFSLQTDLDEKYVYGNSNTSGGSNSHYHSGNTLPSVAAHGHGSVKLSCGAAGGGTDTVSGSNYDNVYVSEAGHSHGDASVTIPGGGGHGHTVPNSAYSSMRPPHIRTFFYGKTVEAKGRFPTGTIILYKTNVNPDPGNWEFVTDKNGYFLSGTCSASFVGTVDTSTSHSHTGLSPSSTNPAHSHGGSGGSFSSGGGSVGAVGGGGGGSSAPHSHSGSIEGTELSGSHSHTCSSSSTVSPTPPYIEFYLLRKK